MGSDYLINCLVQRKAAGFGTQAPQITVSEPWGGLDVQSLGGGASNRDIACRIYAEGVSRSRWGERSTVADCLKVGTSLSRRLYQDIA